MAPMNINADLITFTDQAGRVHPLNPFSLRAKEIRQHVRTLTRRRDFLLTRIESNQAEGLQSRVDFDQEEADALVDAIHCLEGAWDATARINREVRAEAQKIVKLAKKIGIPVEERNTTSTRGLPQEDRGA